MASRNASRLEAGLIARKGEAAPTHSRPQPLSFGSGKQSASPALDDDAEPEPLSRMPKGVQGTIAVTVRLDPDRYERMKVHGARRRRTNQDILVEALDRYFTSLTE